MQLNARTQADGCINTQAKDALSVVDPLSSKNLVVVVDFHWFTDCHPEAIFDVNKRRDLNCDLLHRRRKNIRLCTSKLLFERRSAQYFTLPLAIV